MQEHINHQYHDASVAIGLDELRIVDAEIKFARAVCAVYNEVYTTPDTVQAPCRDLISYSNELIDHVISVYASKLDLFDRSLSYDTESGMLTQKPAFTPRPSLYRAIRLIAKQQ